MITVSKEIISKAKASNNIVEVIQELGIELIKENGHFKACCPFHEEKEPSFKIDPKKQVYNCFGCGNGGDIIKFLIDYKKIEFKDAVNYLLRRAGLDQLTIDNEQLTVKKSKATNENTQIKPADTQAKSETSEPTNQNLESIQTASEQLQSEIEKQNSNLEIPEPKISFVKCRSAAGCSEIINQTFDRIQTENQNQVKEMPQTSSENPGQERRHGRLAPNTNEKPEPEKKELSETERITLLNRVAEFYHKKFLENEKAQNYLFLTRKIKNKSLANAYKIGFSDGSLMKTLENQPEYKTQLITLGVIKQSEKTKQIFEAFKNCVVFPIFDENNNCVNLYGRKIVDGVIKHLYLSGDNKGVFNWQAYKQNQNIIICESIIDCLSFIDAGITNAVSIYGVQGSLIEHIEFIKKFKTQGIYIAFDNDEPGKHAEIETTKKLSDTFVNMDIYKINIPNAKDVNDYYCSNIDKTQCLSDLIKNNSEALRVNKDYKNIVQTTISEKHIIIKIKEITYKIQGFNLSENNIYQTQMKINLRTFFEDNYYVDTFDLYSAKSRDSYKRECAEELGIDEEVIKTDLKAIIYRLEELLECRQNAASPKDYEMSEAEKIEALKFLKSADLFNKILEDFKTLGYIGEETNKLVGYLASVSRKLDDPLAIMIMSRSAAGKSTLMDAILRFAPTEDYIKYTAVTGQALFYKGENSFIHKLLAIVEDEGAARATYSLKTFQSDKELNIASTGKDPLTGKLKTFDYKVKGPISLFITTTAADIDYETLNRFIVLTVDEGIEQTELIHNQQRESETLDGMFNNLNFNAIIKKHQNAQRLLKTVAVSIPYAKYLKFVSDRLRARRDHKKYLGLIKIIAFLRQYQREIKTIQRGTLTLDYVEADLDDLEIANTLAEKVLIRTLDELAPPSRTLLKLIQGMVEKLKKKQKKIKNKIQSKEPVLFSRKEIRDYTKWGDFQIRTHLEQLVMLEYVRIASGNNGKKFHYELDSDSENPEEPTIHLTSKKEIVEAMKG